jgi:hypothetical protein
LKLTIDNLDGKGAVDYSQAVVTAEKFLIKRQFNEPSLCSFTTAPSTLNLAVPARNGRVVVADDNGVTLFTGYVATEPALELVGQSGSGAAYQALVSAVSDEVLLDRQPLPQSLAGVSKPASQLLQGLNARLGGINISFALGESNATIGEFVPDAAQTWSQNAGALASMARNIYRVLNGTVTMIPVGSVVHTLSEANGTLNLSQLEASMVKTLANDVTVCGQDEPCVYVTEFFQGDGATVLFDLTDEPYFPPSSKTKPLIDLFQEPSINPQIWQVNDSGGHISLTAAGLTCVGGDGIDGDTNVCTVNQLEIGGSLVFEAGGVQFGAVTQGIINGIYDGVVKTANCVAGFQISQTSGVTAIAPLINGAVAGSTFAPLTGHMYMLRLRIGCNEMQRVLQTYTSIDDNGTTSYGGTLLTSEANVVLEVQDTTNGVAAAPVVLYSGAINIAPAVATEAPINSSTLECSIASYEISQQGPAWVVSTPPGGSPIVRRMGTTAQGADCKIERTGKLRFYPASTPQAGELIAISYRTTCRAVARLANAQSITQESDNSQLPGTAAWIGTVTSPAPRSSADCENAAMALLDLATSRAAAWKGKYTAWNMETQGDVWPGDVLSLTSASANLNANLVVRSVQIELLSTSPGLAKYVASFANDWADALAIKTSATVPANAWLPQQPETAPPLANLASLSITAVSGSAIQVSANTTPPAGGGFEIRRRDWAFGSGTNSDLVFRSTVPNFSIPRESAMEQYYIRMYDGSTPPNYSRFSSAVFVNVAL